MMYYPMSTGRNMEEIKRLLMAMQTSDDFGVATPANWKPGEEVIVPPPNSCGAAKERMAAKDGDVRVVDWFLSLKKLGGKEEKSSNAAV
jgi:peroxiredoxin (alkyl hydroperoxide reductase subunit C)